MCDGICTNLFGIASNGDSLEDTLRRNRDRITVVAQHITKNHVLERLLVILLCHVDGDVLDSAQLVGILLIGLQLFLAEAACVGARCIDFVTHLTSEIHYIITRVKTAAEGDHHFLLCHTIY